MNKRNFSDDEIGLIMVILAAIVMLLTMIALTGCAAMPERITIRDPAGAKLAEANPETGDITLSWYGIKVLTPRIHLPEAK